MLYTAFKNSIPFLQNAKLGGINAQFNLAPSYRKPYDLEKIKAKKPTAAAILIIFYPDHKNNTTFVLTKRARYDGHHANQISFPGGKQDVSDNNLINTALRETKEEIGIDVPTKSVFKELTQVYIPPSNFLVHPFLAVFDSRPSFITNYEVEEIITPTISDLLNNKNLKTTQVRSSNGLLLDTPYFSLQDEIVWGATAMMLSELRDLVQKIR